MFFFGDLVVGERGAPLSKGSIFSCWDGREDEWPWSGARVGEKVEKYDWAGDGGV